MLKLFKRQIPAIQKISFPTFNWERIQKTKSKQEWVNPKHNITLSLHYFDLPPDIPTMDNIEELRTFYRNLITPHKAGIIEVDYVDTNHVRSLKTLFKFPKTPSGMSYISSLIIPFKNSSYVIKLQATETGITGIRDSAIADLLMQNDEISIGEEGLQGWFADPYSSHYKGGTLMNRSEEAQYDTQFPEHPLSQCRTLMREILSELTFDNALQSLTPLALVP